MSLPSVIADEKREDKEVRKELAVSKADEKKTEELAEEQPQGSLLDTNVLWTIGKEVAGKIIDVFLTQFFKFINYFLKKVEADFEASLSHDSKDEYEVSKSLLASIDSVMRTREFQDRLGAVITHLGEIIQPLIDEMIILMDREGAAFGNTAYGVSQTVAFNFMMGLSDGIQGALALIPGVGTVLDALDILRTILNSGTVMTVAAIQATTVLVTTILGTFDRTAHPIVKMLEELQSLFEMIANAQETVEKGINQKAQDLAKRIAPVPEKQKKEPLVEQEKQVEREDERVGQEQAQVEQEQAQAKQEEGRVEQEQAQAKQEQAQAKQEQAQAKQEQARVEQEQEQVVKEETQKEEKKDDEQQLQKVDKQIDDTEAELKQAKTALAERREGSVTGGKRGGAAEQEEAGASVEELTATIRRLRDQLKGYKDVRQGLKDKLRELGKQALETTRGLGREIVERALGQTLGRIPSREQVVKDVQDRAAKGITEGIRKGIGNVLLGPPRSKTSGGKGTRKLRKRRRSRRKIRYPSKKSKKLVHRLRKSRRGR